MPGFAGFIDKKVFKGGSGILQSMMSSMMHEQFYNSGMFLNERLGMGVGWAVLKDSFGESMPLWNESKDVGMVFHGEDYRDRSEIDVLAAEGHVFERENASYLVHLYEREGKEFFAKLNGRFCGLIINLIKNEIIFFNDRYGLGRIYYYENRDIFYFATEAKSLLKVLPDARRFDTKGLAEYFALGCTLENRSLFAGVSLMPGGSEWVAQSGSGITKNSFVRKEEYLNQPQLSVREYYKKLKETWERILPRYFMGSEKIAVSLTGGKDSRMIMAWARQQPGTLPCYTFNGPYRECLDTRLARDIASACGQPHSTIEVGSDFLAQFPALAEKAVFITDGAMDVSGTPDLYVNRIAREIAPVRLTGNYGQEVLRSAIAFKPMKLKRAVFEPEFYKGIRSAEQLYDDERAGDQRYFVAFKQMPWHHFSRLSLELSQVMIRSPYLDNELVDLSFQTPAELLNSVVPQLWLIAEGDPRFLTTGTDRGLLYRSIPVATSIRSAWKEFTFKAEYAYDYGMPQWMCPFDQVLRPFRLERLFLGRHKFYHFRVWYRDELAGYVKSILFDQKTLSRPYIDGTHIQRIVNAHVAGEANYTLEIHRLLSCELVHRQLVEMK